MFQDAHTDARTDEHDKTIMPPTTLYVGRTHKKNKFKLSLINWKEKGDGGIVNQF